MLCHLIIKSIVIAKLIVVIVNSPGGNDVPSGSVLVTTHVLTAQKQTERDTLGPAELPPSAAGSRFFWQHVLTTG